MKPIWPMKAWAIVLKEDGSGIGFTLDQLLVFRTRAQARRDVVDSQEIVIPVEIRELPKRRTK